MPIILAMLFGSVVIVMVVVGIVSPLSSGQGRFLMPILLLLGRVVVVVGIVPSLSC